MRVLILLLASLALVACQQTPTMQTPTPLARAHAHNDYNHARPLLDALDHGFCSVEADIFLVDGQLLVAHDLEDVRPDRTLQALYLEPLRQRARQFNGRIYPNGPTFTLLIDVKSHGERTFPVLRRVLEEYSDIIDVWDADGAPPRESAAVVAIISGARPRDLMLRQERYIARYDGRMRDLNSDLPPHFMPLVSDSWWSHFNWLGLTEMPAEERQKLRDMVRRAHEKGYRVRFWATPELETVWQELLDAEVDLINTDNLPRLQAFLLQQEMSQQ